MKERTEYRVLAANQIECRAEQTDDGTRYLVGHASVFNHPSKLLFENGRYFNEIIKPGAFEQAIRSEEDVIFTFNHQRGELLARTKSGTLTLEEDEKGLKYRASVPNTTLGNDIYELVKRGDLYENSFAFIVDPDSEEWVEEEAGDVRYIGNISRLFDVAIVTEGAYSNTDVAARSYEEQHGEPDPVIEEEPEPDVKKRSRKKLVRSIQIIKIKLKK